MAGPPWPGKPADGTGILAKGNGQYLYWDRPVPRKLIAGIKAREYAFAPDGQV